MQQLPFDVSGLGATSLLAIGIYFLWRKMEAIVERMMVLWETQIRATEATADALRDIRAKLDSQRYPNDLT